LKSSFQRHASGIAGLWIAINDQSVPPWQKFYGLFRVVSPP
jgi:hypothetical protein